MKFRTAANFCITLLIITIFSSSAYAWARHDLMTSEVVRDLGWLDKFGNMTVTEYLYDDPTVSQIKIQYYNKEYKELLPDEFYNHALYEKRKFFNGSPVGDSISAKQLLADFSDEPDWELDQNLELSWMQAFSGESQGYRHMYYPALSFHMPMGGWPQGQTPERAQHFYDLAKTSFENGDTYWGFRFLARSLHYVQDMSQPYHTRQFYWEFINLKDPFYGTIQTIKNYHFVYESYIGNLFRLEQQGEMPKTLISAVRYSLPVEVESPESLVKYVARRSYWQSSNTMQTSIGFFGESYMGPGAVSMSTEDFFYSIRRGDPAAKAFEQDVERRLTLFGKATKSFLEFARRDLKLDEYKS
jgi:hypothetical protein